MSENSWETFFDAYAPQYRDEPYVHNTKAEVDFIERKFELKPGMLILDAGCGTGRHSLEFARRGYHVTGVDLSGQMLAVAKQSAAAENLC
ncbi:MAG: methyltransferase domain-containing protein, partial [Anaerolineaceae bacterium]